jgi:hypothetical protein
MLGLRAAPFMQQRDGFSCRDAHGFNRRSTWQVTTGVGGRSFALVTGGFTFVFSLLLPSSHRLPRLVLFEFIEGNSSGFPEDAQMRLWFICMAIG